MTMFDTGCSPPLRSYQRHDDHDDGGKARQWRADIDRHQTCSRRLTDARTGKGDGEAQVVDRLLSDGDVVVSVVAVEGGSTARHIF